MSHAECTRQDQADLALAGDALTQLQSRAWNAGSSDVAHLTVEVAPGLVHTLLATTEGVLRNCVMTTQAGAGVDADLEVFAREVIAAGREQRSLYDVAVLDDPRSMRLVEAYAAAGELQRVGSTLRTEFCVYGDSAVVSVETWGGPESDYVLIRDPMRHLGLHRPLRPRLGGELPLPPGARRRGRRRRPAPAGPARARAPRHTRAGWGPARTAGNLARHRRPSV